MPFKDFLVEARLEEAVARFNLPLLEAVNGRLAKVVAALGARAEDDASEAGVDIEALANIMTTIKVIGNRDMRKSITKDDAAGFDPNNLDDMFDVLSKVPDALKASLPADVSKFFKAVAALAAKLKAQELASLKALFDKDASTRQTALNKLKAFSLKVDQMFNKMKTAKA